MSQDTERREQKRLRRLGWEPTTPLPRVCGGPVAPQAPAPNRGQDTERLYCCCGAAGSVCADPDGRLPLSHVDYIADCARQPEFQLLAREVQASRKLVADLRAEHACLPDELPSQSWCKQDGFSWPCPTIRMIDEAGL